MKSGRFFLIIIIFKVKAKLDFFGHQNVAALETLSSPGQASASLSRVLCTLSKAVLRVRYPHTCGESLISGELGVDTEQAYPAAKWWSWEKRAGEHFNVPLLCSNREAQTLNDTLNNCYRCHLGFPYMWTSSLHLASKRLKWVYTYHSHSFPGLIIVLET